MNYYLDTEFIEGFHKPLFGKRRHFIDLVSIGLVSEDDRTYYAISKEFDLNYAWKDVWVRDNVLKPIYAELCRKRSVYEKTYYSGLSEPFSKKSMKYLLRHYSKTNSQIIKEIMEFMGGHLLETFCYVVPENTEIYAYYADYDWVLFCSLFGRMINLPINMPMYCKDLKQIMDSMYMNQINKYEGETRLQSWLKYVKNHPEYPKQENEHNSLSDAKWNKQLHEFLNQL